MDPAVALAVLVALPVVILAWSFAYIKLQSHPSLPGPVLRDYLPGGQLFDLLLDSRKLNRIFSSLSDRYGDVFQMWLGQTHLVVTSVPQDVVQILSTPKTFAKPAALENVLATMAPGGLFTMPHAEHKKTRRILRHNFNHSMLSSFHDHMVEAVNRLCAALTEAANQTGPTGDTKVCDLTELLAATTFRIITNVAFGTGMTEPEIREFGDMMATLVDELQLDVVGYPFRQALSVFGTRRRLFACKSDLDATCHKFIKRRLHETPEERRSRHTDVLDSILEICDGDMTKAISMAVEFATAGSHTTNEMLAWCIYDICRHPHVEAKLEKEILDRFGDRPWSEPITLEDMQSLPYVAKVWKETCRRRPILVLVVRRAAKDVDLKGSGIRIRKGKHVFAHMYRAQTNPRTWRDPLTFDPERWGSGDVKREGDCMPPGSYIPFGIGPRACAGRFLADYSAPLILTELVRRFKFELGCEPNEIVSSSCFVETPKHIPSTGEPSHIGVPVRVRMRPSP